MIPFFQKNNHSLKFFLLIIISTSSLVSACSVNPDVNDAGLLDSIHHLSKNTYQDRKEQKLQFKSKLKKRINNNKKRLHTLNQQLQHKLQQSHELQEKLQKNKTAHKTEGKDLENIKTLHFSNKIKMHSLQQEIKKLDQHIILEKEKNHKKTTYILSLEKKRNKLRKEILLQISL